MLKVAFIVYRQWGYEIFKKIKSYQNVRKDFSLQLLILNKSHQCKVSKKDIKNNSYYIIDEKDHTRLSNLLLENEIDLAFFYSWSFFVPEEITQKIICLCLHPSLLPKYRGGTPIQYQLINNENFGGVTVFKMNNITDSGPIYKQEPISLSGDLNDIFKRMVDVGYLITQQLLVDAINDNLKFRPQDRSDKIKILKRRKPKESEILFSDLENMTFMKLNNLVRGLLDPYPNAFISFKKDKIYLQKIEYFKKISSHESILTSKSNLKRIKIKYLKLQDGYAKIIKGSQLGNL